jgi:hypothetical protein
LTLESTPICIDEVARRRLTDTQVGEISLPVLLKSQIAVVRRLTR